MTTIMKGKDVAIALKEKIKAGVAELKDIKKLGKIGLKTFVFYFLTTTFAIILGLAFTNVLKPGSGFTLPTTLKEVKVNEAPNFIDTLINIIPSNPMKSIVEVCYKL